MGGPIYIMEQKECESMRCESHTVTSLMNLTLTLDFQGQFLKKLYLMNSGGGGDQHATKRIWVDWMLYLLCFQLVGWVIYLGDQGCCRSLSALL